MRVRAFGYQMSPLSAVKLWVKRMVCDHARMKFYAATCAQKEGTSNIRVGMTARCPDCRSAWSGDVVAGAGSSMRAESARK